MRRIAYYVTGHGFGHATRTGAIIQAILDADPRVSVEIVSAVPPWIFKELETGAGPGTRKDLVDHVIAELVRHSIAEEQHMYPAARKYMPKMPAWRTKRFTTKAQRAQRKQS